MTALRWNDHGLIPAILQDASDGTVLMMAWMNEEALRLTVARGEAVFWSRSRQEIWHKGATSGNVMRVRSIHYDCDGDTLLLQVDPAGPACHTGAQSCFYRTLEGYTMDEKIMTQHPQGKQGVNISRAKYEQVRDAIIGALEEAGTLTFTELVEAVERRLAGNFDGSIPWYTTTVKLDLEARDVVERVPGTTPQQVRLVGGAG